MFKIQEGHKLEFEKIMENLRYYINELNIYSYNIQFINGHHKHLDRDIYNACFRNGLSDIELVSHPMDIIIPYAEEVDKENTSDDAEPIKPTKMFCLNYDIPESKTVKERLTRDVICNSLHPALPLTLDVINKKIPEEEIIDDILLYFFVYKFSDEISVVRLHKFSNMSPLIEYIVNNITMKDIENYITTTKINIDKYAKKCSEFIFNKEFAMVEKYFDSDEVRDHNIEPFDVQKLIMMLATNITIQSDLSIVIGIFETISFSMVELHDQDKDDNTRCIEFVRNLSLLTNSL